MKQKNQKSKLWLRFLAFLINANKKCFLLSSLLILLLTGITLVQTRVIQKLVDETIEFNLDGMLQMLFILIGIVVFNIIFNYLKVKETTQFGARSGAFLKNYLCHKILYCKYKDISTASRGDILKTVNDDIEGVCDFLSNNMTNLLTQLVMLIAAVIYLICINPMIGIISFVYTPLGMCLTYHINGKMGKLYPKIENGKGHALAALEQIIGQIQVVKSFGMQKRRLKKVNAEYEHVHDVGMKVSKYDGLLQTACSSVSSIPRLIFFCIACWLIVNNHITLGVMVSINQLLDYIIGPTVFFPFLLDGLNQSKACMERIQTLIDNLEVIKDNTIIHRECSKEPYIEMKNVTFAYDERNVLEKFNFNVDKCGITIISGQSGRGKTTILDLISKIQYPNNGQVKVNGKVFVVTQETFIFIGTIIDNVRIARPEATDQEVIEALRLACMDEFCMSLKHGYNSMIGDGYTDFSGGQKQRISLARMFLTDANILLLDEPTSSLDVDTENKIIKEIVKISKDKIIIISAHRDSLFKIADRRYELYDKSSLKAYA